MSQELIAFSDALKKISNYDLNLTDELILVDESLGRVIKEDIYVKIESPEWSTSAMDGFAVKYTDTIKAEHENPIKLKIIKTVNAGDPETSLEQPGFCYRINTGAPIPVGANAVVKIEDVEMIDSELYVFSPVKRHLNIVKKGDYGETGVQVIQKGQIICPQDISFMKTQGIQEVKVQEQVNVSIIASGNELVDEYSMTYGKIVETNSSMIKNIISNPRVNVVMVGIIRDEVQGIMNEILNSSKKSHIVLVIGGTSKGTKDLVPIALDSLLNSEKIIHGVKIKPGKPFGAWKLDGNKIVFLSPGPPYASFLTTKVFIEPFLQICTIGSRYFDIGSEITINIENTFEIKSNRLEFLRVKINCLDQEINGKIIGIKGSGDFIATCHADAILIPKRNSNNFVKGEKVKVFLIRPIAIPNDYYFDLGV